MLNSSYHMLITGLPLKEGLTLCMQNVRHTTQTVDSGTEDFVSFGWATVLSPDGVLGKAKSATFYLPKEMSQLIKEVPLVQSNLLTFRASS